jgi:hypothetical protein
MRLIPISHQLASLRYCPPNRSTSNGYKQKYLVNITKIIQLNI